MIPGGKSGIGARSMDDTWGLDICDQCKAAGLAFFFKRWGGVNKKKAGRELDEKFYDEMPTMFSKTGR